MVQDVCVCLTGMYLNGSACEVCGSMAGCLTCDMQGCTGCDDTFGFELNTTTSQCECSYGEYINSMSVCQQCEIVGCLDC